MAAWKATLQSLQIRDQVVLVRIAQHVLIARHTAPALIDPGPDRRVRRLLPVEHLVLLVEAFEPGPPFLSVGLRVVAHRAHVEYGFALSGIALGGGRHRLGPRGQANAQRKNAKSMHSQTLLQRSLQLSYNAHRDLRSP